MNNDVIMLVSHACEERLRQLTEKVTLVAEHRLDTYRVSFIGLFDLFDDDSAVVENSSYLIGRLINGMNQVKMFAHNSNSWNN